MKFVSATDPIPVSHPIFLIVGEPGVCKTSLAYSCHDPILLDHDLGAHRAINRKDTLQIEKWADVAEARTHPAFVRAKTVIVDTVGRCLDQASTALVEENPKNAQGAGNLSQSGWGNLKRLFTRFVGELRTDKDVLFLAHAKEDKDGDVRKIRADIQGGSYAEVMKIADFVGFIRVVGKDRILDFSPTENWVGKNPGQWAPFKIPPADKADGFLAKLFDDGRAVLGKISEEGQDVTKKVDGWRIVIAALETPDACTSAVPTIAALPPILAAPVKKLLLDRSKALGLVFNKQAKRFEKKAA